MTDIFTHNDKHYENLGDAINEAKDGDIIFVNGDIFATKESMPCEIKPHGIRLLCVKFLDAELSLLRWLVQNKFTTGAKVLPTILQIRQARERIINE